MPKSKRVRAVNLSAKVTANPRARKEKLVDDIQNAVDEYERAFVFEFDNMRSNYFKQLRVEWGKSRFFLGKNRVMQLALGLDSETEFRPNLSELAADVVGLRGLLFTNRPEAEVLDFFANFAKIDYARSGATATATVTIPAGELEGMSHVMTPTLTKLGMPVKLVKGVVMNTADYDICKEGETLNPDQARLLKLFEKPLATFRVELMSVWNAADNSYKQLAVDTLAAGAAGGSGDGPVELSLNFD